MSKNGPPQNGAPESWTVTGLLDYFASINERMEDRAFAFVLGAGASRTSGIPIGSELVDWWLQDLKRRLVPEDQDIPIDEWATAQTLGITGFEFARASEFYPQVYSRRFQGDPEEGFAYLESIIEKKVPSPGYLMLAQILVHTRHRVVITTNFDNLVTDAIAMYDEVRPLVCGHESLTQFVRVRMRRPLVAKIHRDLLLSPVNDPTGTSRLAPEWREALKGLLKNYTPVFIGYGGNDGSLMGFLKSLEQGEIIGRLLWCYREPDGVPKEEIRTLVERHNGALIPIPSFDEFMLQLGARLGFSLRGERIEKHAREWEVINQSRLKEIKERLSQPGRVKEVAGTVVGALSATLSQGAESGQGLFDALLTSEMGERMQLFEEGLSNFPKDQSLLLSYADFATRELKDNKKAGELYERALELFPESDGALTAAARFYAFSLSDYERAKSLLEKALELNPEHSEAAADLGLVLLCRGNDREAERWLRRALDIDPANARAMSNYGIILGYYRNHPEEAEQQFRKSVELRPDDASLLANLAQFLFDQGRADEAGEAAESGWRLADKEANRIMARLAFLRAAAARIKGRDDTEPLEHLKYILKHGFQRNAGLRWKQTLQTLGKKLPKDELPFFQALGAAILKKEGLKELHSFERWRALTPRGLGN